MITAHSRWKLVLTTLAFTLTAPALAQDAADDPFLQAMMQDEQKAQEEQAAEARAKAREAAERSQAFKEEARKAAEDGIRARKDGEADAKKAAAETATQLAQGDSTPLLDDAVVSRELGPQTGLFHNDAAFDGKKVTRVVFRYAGNRTLPDSRLRDVVQTREGSRYSATRINADLERLISRGMVDSDTRVSATPENGGVAVIFDVRASSVLAGVGFTGNKFFKDKELREAVGPDKDTHKPGLGSGVVINDKSLARAKSDLIKHYQEACYPDTRVDWYTAATSNGSYKDVVFRIQEGERQVMNHIKFKGNRAFDSKQLRSILETKEKGVFTWLTSSGRIDRETVEDDLQKIVKHYRNYGYLRARIKDVKYYAEGKSLWYTGAKEIRMDVTIEEGPRYEIQNVSFGPISVFTPKELERGLSMLGGDIYSLKKVSDDVEMIRKYYGSKGYADADVRPDITEVGVKPNGTHLINIRYDVKEGGRYLVGRINVRGNTKTKQHVILRELPLKPGQNLNSVDLEIARKRLENLKYFDQVEVSEGYSGNGGYRDININVHETTTGNASFGVAFSSIESVYLYTTVTQSNFNLGGLLGGSFVGGGQRLTLNGRLGTEYQSASIFLLEPWFLNRRLQLGNEAYFSSSTYMSDYYRQKNYGYAVSLRRALGDLQSVKFEYRIEQFKLEQQGNAPVFFREQCGDYTRSKFELSYEYDSRDAVITPRSGGNLELHGYYSGPGSTVQTYGMGMSASYYYNSFWDSIFSLNLAADTVKAVDKNKEVPVFERCYLGGPNNLRGFRYRDVGMIDKELAGDETMGGNSSAYAQLEMTLPLVDSIRLAVFVDAGFVHKDSFDFRMNQFAADYGVGLRLNLPMGPLAVDYAIPFKTANAADDKGQFQFYVDYKY
ncbi:MAG: outer membrane protein assembly factor BamA [Akkermansia sp.]|nr:outer membrane protein assembly factor BamA [Akkermansia sp.]